MKWKINKIRSKIFEKKTKLEQWLFLLEVGKNCQMYLLDTHTVTSNSHKK